MRYTMMALLLAAMLGCAEEPQVVQASVEPGAATDGWNQQLRQRSLRQSESQRIYH